MSHTLAASPSAPQLAQGGMSATFEDIANWAESLFATGYCHNTMALIIGRTKPGRAESLDATLFRIFPRPVEQISYAWLPG